MLLQKSSEIKKISVVQMSNGFFNEKVDNQLKKKYYLNNFYLYCLCW